MTKFLLFISILVFTAVPRSTDLRKHLIDNKSGHVLIVAHRGDWRNFPENSLEAIQSAIDMGIDVVEIDVTLTKDSIPVLMHDNSIERTTTGKGKVSNLTYAQLKNFKLRDGLGRPTDIPIPTMEEAMKLAKGKVLVNLDKSEDIIPFVYKILKTTNTVDHVVIGSYDTYAQMREKAGPYLDSILFMPKIREKTENISRYLKEYYDHIPVEVVQFGFEDESSPVAAYADSIAKKGTRAWINTITADRCANHDDNRAVKDPDGSYGWVLKKGFNMIQTDRLEMLRDYLKKNGRRKL